MAGLRERHRARTREVIQEQALRLIAEQGYDGTTCAQVAAAAAISPATLFRYFPTKEDMVLQDPYDPMIAEAVRLRPAAEPPLTAVRRGLADAFAEVYESDLEEVRARTELILSVPALRSRMVEQQESLTAHLSQALADRNPPAEPAGLAPQVAAAACAAALGVAVEHWASAGGHLPDHVDAALVALVDLVQEG